MSSKEMCKGLILDEKQKLEDTGLSSNDALAMAAGLVASEFEHLGHGDAIRQAYAELENEGNATQPTEVQDDSNPTEGRQRSRQMPQHPSWLHLPPTQQFMLLRTAADARLTYEAALRATDPALLDGPSWEIFQETNNTVHDELQQVLAARGRAIRDARTRLSTKNSQNDMRDRNLVRAANDVENSRRALLPYLRTVEINGLNNSGELIPLFALAGLNVYDAWTVVDPDNFDVDRHRDRVEAAFGVFVRQVNGEGPGYGGLQSFDDSDDEKGLDAFEDDVAEEAENRESVGADRATLAGSSVTTSAATEEVSRGGDSSLTLEQLIEKIGEEHSGRICQRQRRAGRSNIGTIDDSTEQNVPSTTVSNEYQDMRRAMRARTGRRPLTELTYGDYVFEPPRYGEEEEFDMSDPATTARRERDRQAGRYGYHPPAQGLDEHQYQHQKEQKTQDQDRSMIEAHKDSEHQNQVNKPSHGQGDAQSQPEDESERQVRDWQNNLSYTSVNNHVQTSLNIGPDGWPVCDYQTWDEAQPAPESSRSDPYETEHVPPLSSESNFVGTGRTLGSSSDTGPSNAGPSNAGPSTAGPSAAETMTSAPDHPQVEEDSAPRLILRQHAAQSIERDNALEAPRWAPSADEKCFNQLLEDNKYIVAKKREKGAKHMRKKRDDFQQDLIKLWAERREVYERRRDSERRERAIGVEVGESVEELTERFDATQLEMHGGHRGAAEDHGEVDGEKHGDEEGSSEAQDDLCEKEAVANQDELCDNSEMSGATCGRYHGGDSCAVDGEDVDGGGVGDAVEVGVDHPDGLEDAASGDEEDEFHDAQEEQEADLNEKDDREVRSGNAE